MQTEFSVASRLLKHQTLEPADRQPFVQEVHLNPIQQVLQSRIDTLIANAKGVAAFGHAGTIGHLREKLLIDFFHDLVPKSLSISSGIVCDAKGRVSRQTDFIVKNDYILPPMVMMESVAIVPVDTVHLTAEIKSTLKTEHLTKFTEDRTQFNKLELATWPAPPPGVEVKIPSVILAYENVVAIDTLTAWMRDTNDIVAICIVGSFSLSKTNNGIDHCLSGSDCPRHWELLTFASQLFKFLSESLLVPRGRPLWDAFLLGVSNSEEASGE